MKLINQSKKFLLTTNYFSDEGIYNTYVLDSDYLSWSLLLHCAEKSKTPRYLSSFIMSREQSLGNNVISYLRDKLPRYDIDLSYMFDMSHEDCDIPQNIKNIPPSILANMLPPHKRRHPLKSHHQDLFKKVQNHV